MTHLESKLKSKLTDEDKNHIIEQYAKGFGVATIARRIGFKSSPVMLFIEKQGLKRSRQDSIPLRSYEYDRVRETKETR